MEDLGTNLRQQIASINKSKTSASTEQQERDARVFAAGQYAARGLPPGVELAEKLAKRARQLQAASPGMSNIEATHAAYREAGVALE